jgi:hypothetical protein
MAILKPKYPAFHRPFMHCERQGYGAYRGGNASVVANNNQEQNLSFTNEAGELGRTNAFGRGFSDAFDSYNYIK